MNNRTTSPVQAFGFDRADVERDNAAYRIGPLFMDDPDADHGLSHVFFEYQTALFIVTKVDEERRASLILFDGDKVRAAGSVAIPCAHGIPAPGSVVKCRYLHAVRELGRVYGPRYLGVQPRGSWAECTVYQLKSCAEFVHLHDHQAALNFK